MNWQISAYFAGFILLALLLKRMFWREKKTARHPYQRNSVLFSADDRAFFRALQDAVGAEYEIFGKIHVSDIIVPKKSASVRAVNVAFNPIAARHFDFVLCEKKMLSVACALQLQDKSHSNRQNEEDPLLPICEHVGLPFVRFPIKAEYSSLEILEKLRIAMVKEPLSLVETDGRKEPRISNLDDIKF
jgi:hypothetical protein